MEATQKAGALDVQGALHIAIRRGWESAVAKLLSLGADAGLKDGDGMTALMLACANKKIEAAALLLMEATQKAGALDVQVNVVWSVWCEGCEHVVWCGVCGVRGAST